MGIGYKGRIRAKYNASTPGKRAEPTTAYKVSLWKNFWSGRPMTQETGIECPQCKGEMKRHKHGRHTSYYRCTSCGYESRQ